MPQDHARKNALADLKESYEIRHTCAIKLHDLAKRDPGEAERVAEFFEYSDINTYAEAVEALAARRADPGYDVLCEVCGWLNNMVCPECAKGCGCENRCTGWRHGEWNIDDDPEPWECDECGAGHEYDCDC